MIIERHGDIWDTPADVVGHGVNLRGVMGAGLAAQVREKFPDVFEQYRKACSEGSLKPGGVQIVYRPGGLNIANIASQVEPGPNARYDLLVSGICNTMIRCYHSGLSLALPQIGCGIGGLEWEVVREIICGLAEFYRVDTELWTYGD